MFLRKGPKPINLKLVKKTSLLWGLNKRPRPQYFSPPRGPVPPVLERTIFMGKIWAGPQSDYGTGDQHTRTVSHYDPHEKDRILIIRKYTKCYWTQNIVTWMDFPTRIDTESCTNGRRTAPYPPATTSNMLGFFCRPRGPLPPVLWRNDLHGNNEAGPHSDYRTSYHHTRTVSHYDKYFEVWKRSHPNHGEIK